MVFQGRLRFADAERAQQAVERLRRVELLSESVARDGPVLRVDAQGVADAAQYPELIALLDEVADEAIGGSVTARLGGQPSDWVGAAGPLPGVEGLSPEAQDLLRACIGGDADAVEAGREDVVASDTLVAELVAGYPLLEDPEQRALLVLLVGDRFDAELEPIMRGALALPAGEDLFDLARHLAVCFFAGTHDVPFEWTDRDKVAAAIDTLEAQLQET